MNGTTSQVSVVMLIIKVLEAVFITWPGPPSNGHGSLIRTSFASTHDAYMPASVSCGSFLCLSFQSGLYYLGLHQGS